MDDEAAITRPSADDFLTIIRRQQLGKLKVYLGACPGVGKTYAMLREGHRLKERGVDVVIGYVEPRPGIPPSPSHTIDLIGEMKRQGVKIGRPRSLSPRVRTRIRRMRGRGMTLEAIARKLNDEGVPTAQGGKRWYAATVRAIAA